MKELKELKKDIERTIGRVAAEYSYAKDLQNKLEEIEKKEPDTALKEIRKAFRILRWTGRAERRIDQSEQRIIKELEELGKELPENLKVKEAKLLEQLKIAEAKLIKAASVFTGELREDLLKIKTDMQLLKKIEDNQKIQLDLQRLYQRAKTGVEELVRWISTTETILKQISEFEESLERLAA
ncbi:MAG: hypothetical protein ABIA37_02045 [Candidatus Woesearchaeota archaeon]